MTTVTAHLTNKAYDFPTRGAGRRVKAPLLACIHITGNRRTAADADRHQAADLRARSGLTTEQLIYRGRAEGWLEVAGLEPGSVTTRPACGRSGAGSPPCSGPSGP